MNRISRLLLSLVLAGTLASSLSVPSHANKGPIAGSAAVRIGDPIEERWWGVAAAAGCGFGIRATVLTGQPWVGFATGFVCAIALFDIIT